MRCELCPLHQNAKEQVVPKGTFHPEIYIVGEAPGREENEQGIPFVGKSGMYLHKILKSLGLDESNTRIFNVVRCIPLNEQGGIRPPSPEEMEACSRYVFADIAKTKPKVILAVGSTSAQAFLKQNFTRISEVRGKVYHTEIHGQSYPVVPTYHPAYLLRQANNAALAKEFIADIKLALNIAKGIWKQDEGKDLRVALSFDEFLKFCQEYYPDTDAETAYDIETNGRHPLSAEAKVVGFSIAPNKYVGIYVPFEALEFKMPDEDREAIRDYMRDFLKNRKKVVVHNQKYERPFTLNPNWLGIELDLEQLDDTLVMARLMLGGQTGAGLKERCMQDLGYQDWSKDLDHYRELVEILQKNLYPTSAGNKRPELLILEETGSITALRDRLVSQYGLEEYLDVLSSDSYPFDQMAKLLGNRVDEIKKLNPEAVVPDKRVQKVILGSCRVTALLKKYYEDPEEYQEIDKLFTSMLYSRIMSRDESFLSYGCVPLKLIAKYGAMDAVATLDLRDYYVERMKKESEELGLDLFKGYKYWMMHFEMGYVMERNGAHWDEGRVKKDLKFLEDKAIEALRNVHMSPLIDEFLVEKSKRQMAEFLVTHAQDLLPLEWRPKNITSKKRSRKKIVEFVNGEVQDLGDESILQVLEPAALEDLKSRWLAELRERMKTEFNSIEDFKSYFNPSSSHVSNREFLAKVLITDDIKLAKFWELLMAFMADENFNVDNFSGSDKVFLKAVQSIAEKIEGVKKLVRELEDEEIEIHPEWRDLEEDAEVTIQISRKEGFEEFKRLVSETQFHSPELIQLYADALNFELPNTSESVIVAIKDLYVVTGIDIEDPNTWNENFKFLYNFRLFKKCNKLISSYITGKLGRQSVWIVDRKQMESGENFIVRKRPYYSCDGKLDEETEAYLLQTDFNTCGAETGRWRAGIHTIPFGAIVKEFYTSRFPGGTIAAPDFSQMEIRTMAAAAKEEKLLQAFREGADIHLYNAAAIWKKPMEEVTESERRFAKMASFSVLYGASAYSLAQQYFKGNVKEAEEFLERFYSTFPKIREFIQEKHRQMEETGRVTLLTQRYIYISPKGTDKAAISAAKRAAQNYPIQGASSDVAGVVLYKVWEYIKKNNLKTKPFCFIHDSIEIDIHPLELLQICKQIIPLMNEFPVQEWGLPVKAGLVIGSSMGEEIEVDELETDESFNEGSMVLIGFEDEILRLTENWKKVYRLVEVLDIPDEKTGKPTSIEPVYQPLGELFIPKRAFSRYAGTYRNFGKKKVNIIIK